MGGTVSLSGQLLAFFGKDLLQADTSILGDLPVPIAETIAAHGRNTLDYANYGSVGYMLKQNISVNRTRSILIFLALSA